MIRLVPDVDDICFVTVGVVLSVGGDEAETFSGL